MNFKTTIKCDICGATIRITQNSKYLLEKELWLVYCKECADKIGIDPVYAKEHQIKIYKK